MEEDQRDILLIKAFDFVMLVHKSVHLVHHLLRLLVITQSQLDGLIRVGVWCLVHHLLRLQVITQSHLDELIRVGVWCFVHHLLRLLVISRASWMD